MKFLFRLTSIFLCIGLFAQSATAAIVPSIPYNLTNGSLADATQVMGNFNTIITDVNANAANNGINSDITSITGLTTPLSNAQGGTAFYTAGTSTGSANAQAFSIVSPFNFILATGNFVTGIAGFSNTGAMTLNTASTGVESVDKITAAGLASVGQGDVILGGNYTFFWDGTEYQLLNPTQSTGIVTGPGSSTTNDVATYNGSGGNVIKDSGVLISSLIRTVKTQVFTSTGTYTPSTGMLYAQIICTGSGGGGGGVGTAGSNENAGGGGGGGSTSIIVVSAATVGTSQAVTVGAAGTGGVNTGGTGGAGNDVSVGSLCVGKGAAGGVGANSSSGTAALGGAGGVAGTGDITPVGMPGGTSVGGSNNAANCVSGSGASSWWGGGALSVIVTSGTSAGNAGTNYGSGGSGACTGTTTGAAGGAGAKGVVYITEYNAQ